MACTGSCRINRRRLGSRQIRQECHSGTSWFSRRRRLPAAARRSGSPCLDTAGRRDRLHGQISSDPNFVDPLLTKSYSTKTSSFVVPSPQVATQYYWRARHARDRRLHRMVQGPRTRSADWQNLNWCGPSTVRSAMSKTSFCSGNQSAEPRPTTFRSAPTSTSSPLTPARPTSPERHTHHRSPSPTTSTTGESGRWTHSTTSVIGTQSTRGSSDATGRTSRSWSTDRRSRGRGPVLLSVDSGGARQQLHRPAEQLGGLQPNRHHRFLQHSAHHVRAQDGFGLRPGAAGAVLLACHRHGFAETLDDKSIVTDGILAERGQFTYQPERPSLVSPLNGTSVSTPTLRWGSVSGADSYRVTITALDGGSEVAPSPRRERPSRREIFGLSASPRVAGADPQLGNPRGRRPDRRVTNRRLRSQRPRPRRRLLLNRWPLRRDTPQHGFPPSRGPPLPRLPLTESVSGRRFRIGIHIFA